MKVLVNPDKCIGCGNCVALSNSELFDFNEDGVAYATVDEVPADLEEMAHDAINQCPTDAIYEEEVK